MPVPFRRKSRSRSRMHRASTMRYNIINYINCSNCTKVRLPHHICLHCGYYNNKQVLVINKKV